MATVSMASRLVVLVVKIVVHYVNFKAGLTTEFDSRINVACFLTGIDARLKWSSGLGQRMSPGGRDIVV